LQKVTALQAATILVRHREWKKYLATKILAKSPIGDLQIKRKMYLKNHQ